ncbi:hypothetical protein WA1_42655 [Scytonema hofmannii PCC 7110]|uniref:Uncharacterized protein n=1 Tax=Scytonema hofmannii PCC 7110 TaxID=128403 RepID=A0A139WVE3_9CYAN|nr:hypothetical protein [Scytonema hofmannii]KYC36410.1 hypothetical protein WA1_42655 [Scytonema hofmannii PCC 7110]
MLTLEREVTQIISKLPQKIKLEFYSEFGLDNRDLDDQRVYLGEQLPKISDAIRQLAEKIENNLSKYTQPEELENSRYASDVIKEIIKDIEKQLLKKSDIQAKQGERYIFLEQGLSSFKQALEKLSDVLDDTIEFVEIASEIEELRSKPLDASKIQEAEEILSLL